MRDIPMETLTISRLFFEIPWARGEEGSDEKSDP